ncbi:MULTISPECIES: hypothetical protein [Streptomyces]|uniref:hypothetical protein n=1 Tax=Streptomyces TaxID=1883 RepID=UPI000A55F23C|nr:MULTISPECIES: hypothetical protein [Streptomyces]
MPADRQQRQQNAPTCEDSREHRVSIRQRRQHTPQPVLTLLTPADACQHSKAAGRRVPLTVLTFHGAEGE